MQRLRWEDHIAIEEEDVTCTRLAGLLNESGAAAGKDRPAGIPNPQRFDPAAVSQWCGGLAYQSDQRHAKFGFPVSEGGDADEYLNWFHENSRQKKWLSGLPCGE